MSKTTALSLCIIVFSVGYWFSLFYRTKHQTDTIELSPAHFTSVLEIEDSINSTDNKVEPGGFCAHQSCLPPVQSCWICCLKGHYGDGIGPMCYQKCAQTPDCEIDPGTLYCSAGIPCVPS